MACNFNCVFKNEGLFKVTCSHTLNVVVSWKWCKVESLFLQTIIIIIIIIFNLKTNKRNKI